MKDIQMVEFKRGMKNYLEAITKCSIAYINSEEFRKSQYDLYSAEDLNEAIKNEERDEVKHALVFLFHYKAERKLFKSPVAFTSHFSCYS
jgi:hypothetical protein